MSQVQIPSRPVIVVIVVAVALLVIIPVLFALPSRPMTAPTPHGLPSLGPPPGLATPSFPKFNETTATLPGFDPLYGYVLGNNCLPGMDGCFRGGSNFSQIPVLSSDSNQPFGIYYVNNDSQLVEYVLANGSVRTVANVTLLHQAWAWYGGMLANEFFVPYGYDEALFFGTYASYAKWVSVEAVNLSTGAVRFVNTTVNTTPSNQQPILIGPETAVILSATNICTNADDCQANVTGVDLTNGTEWSAGTLPFFEANNVYWLPQRGQLLDVEAAGSTHDRVDQLNESLNRFGEAVFSLAASVTVDNAIPVNWVNGLGYNPSSGRIAYSSGGDGWAFTYVLGYDSSGQLTTNGMVRYNASGSRLLEVQQYVYTSDYLTGGYVGETQYFFDPWNGSTVATNEPFTNLTPFNVCDGSCFLGTYGPSPDYRIDFHATVARNDPFWTVVVALA